MAIPIRPLIFLLVLLAFFTSCKSDSHQAEAIDSLVVAPPVKMKSMQLPNGWTINVPLEAGDSTGAGDDYNFGVIFAPAHFLFLEYECGVDTSEIRPCDLDANVHYAEKQAEYWGESNNYTFRYKVYTDTIGTRVAFVATPDMSGADMMISISDCATGAWLTISQPSPGPNEQKLLWEMFETIDNNLAK